MFAVNNSWGVLTYTSIFSPLWKHIGVELIDRVDKDASQLDDFRNESGVKSMSHVAVKSLAQDLPSAGISSSSGIFEKRNS